MVTNFSSARANVALDAAASRPGITVVNGPPGLGHRDTVHAWMRRSRRAEQVRTVRSPIDTGTILATDDDMVILEVAPGTPVDLAELAEAALDTDRACLVVLSEPVLPALPSDASAIPSALFVLTQEETTDGLAALGIEPTRALALATFSSGWPGLLQQMAQQITDPVHVNQALAESGMHEYLRRTLVPWLPEAWLESMRYLAVAGCAGPSELAKLPGGTAACHALMTLELATAVRAHDDDYGIALIPPLRAIVIDGLDAEGHDRERLLNAIVDIRFALGVADCGLRAAYELLDWDRCATILDRWWRNTVLNGHRELGAEVIAALPEGYLRQFPMVAQRAEYLGVLPIGSVAIPIPRKQEDIDAALRSGAATRLMERSLLGIATRTIAGRSQEAAQLARDMAPVVHLAGRLPGNGARELSSFWHLHAGLACQMAGDDATALQYYAQGWSDREWDCMGSTAQDLASKLALLTAARGELEQARRWLARHDELPPVADWTASYIDRSTRIARYIVNWEQLEPSAPQPSSLLEDVYANDTIWPYALLVAVRAALGQKNPDEVLAITDRAMTSHAMAVTSDGFQPQLLRASRALAHLALGQGTLASVALGTVADDDPWGTPVHSLILLLTDRAEEAAAYAQRAARRPTFSPRSRRQLRLVAAAALVEIGRVDEAAAPLALALDEAEVERDRRSLTLVPEVYRKQLAAAFPERADQLSVGSSLLAGDATWVELSDREMVVLQELARGKVLRQIAETHFVSKNTVKTQVRSIYLKLNVNSRLEAIEVAEQLGLLNS